MLFYKKKISDSLYTYMKSDYYEKYRILIKFKKFHKEFDKVISSLGGEVLFNYTYINLICANLSNKAIKRIIEYPEVSYISLDEDCFLCGLNINTINAGSYSDNLGLSGRGVKLAILDSGTFPHPDLTSPNRIIAFTDLINNYRYPYDDNGHGTAVSTVIAGSGISSKFKIKGIAPKSLLYSYKIFDKTGKAYLSNIFNALELLVEDCEKFNIKILCMPFETFNTDIKHITYFDELLNIIISKGIIPIMPSGSNCKNSNIRGIANTQNSILVSALNNDGTPFEYSPIENKHKKIDISAKCINIACGTSDCSYESERNSIKVYPPKLKEFYTSYSGPSIATAYITGICSLLIEKYPNYTFHDVASRIELCSERIEGSPSNARVLDLETFLS
ncbi:MAG: S8 family serine peptidase [Sarcina sp.]